MRQKRRPEKEGQKQGSPRPCRGERLL